MTKKPLCLINQHQIFTTFIFKKPDAQSLRATGRQTDNLHPTASIPIQKMYLKMS